MIRTAGASLLLILFSGLIEPLGAMPQFLMLFQADPLRNTNIDGCGTCHQNPAGGGPRNDFGLAFAEEVFRITPMLRASFPDNFTIETTELADGAAFYFSDPDSRYVVYAKEDERRLIDLEAVLEGRATTVNEVEEEDPFSFFVTSMGPGNGGDLGALAGADRHCQQLAEAVGTTDKTWHAYLSTSLDGRPVVNAGDRIGTGPWYNVNGVRIARGVVDLHGSNNNLNERTALTENGDVADLHDILTGTNADGTASSMTCGNWMNSNESDNALLGHFDRQGGGDDPTSWNAAHPSRGCSQENLRGTGGDGSFYCFATD